jgi:hypothetical protein
MSGDFKDYLDRVHRGPQDKKAAIKGLRYDAYGVGQSSGGRGREMERGSQELY